MTRAVMLASLHRQFQAYVLDGRPGIETCVMSTAPAGADERLQVYADAYRLRLVEVLGKDYPALRKLAGEPAFRRIARTYIDRHPSDTRSVRWFGRHLAAFLRRQAAYRRRPALGEMAEFEWQQGVVFDAPNAAVISIDALSAIAPEHWAGLRFVLHPSVRRLELAWDVPQLWQALQHERRSRKPRRAASLTSWLLWRRGLEVRWRSLPKEEAAALDAVAAGEPYAAVCERLGGQLPAEWRALHAASLLKTWVNDGLIAAVRPS